MDMITVYLAGALVLNGAFALRSPHEDLRTVFLLALVWPLSLLAILFMFVLTATGWNMDLAKGTQVLGFRKPQNPELTGFAFTVLFQEFQFFKVRNVVDTK